MIIEVSPWGPIPGRSLYGDPPPPPVLDSTVDWLVALGPVTYGLWRCLTELTTEPRPRWQRWPRSVDYGSIAALLGCDEPTLYMAYDRLYRAGLVRGALVAASPRPADRPD